MTTKLVYLFGPILLTGGIVNYFLTPYLVKLIMQNILVIEQGKIFYEKWIQTPVPFKFDLYVFDIQNPSGIMKGQKPMVKEIGPFSFLETRKKKILNFSRNKATVSYLETRIFKFNREKSVGDLDQHYITPNLPFLATIKVWNESLKKIPLLFLVQPLIGRLLYSIMEFYQQNLFINVTVDEIMFKGVHLNFLPLLQLIVQTFGRSNVGSGINSLSNSSLAFFKYLNDSASGPYEVYTGAFDLNRLTELKSYTEKDKIFLWPDADCNVVKGSDGVQFAPLRKEKSKLYVFANELCRTVTLEYKRDSEVRGIKTYRYELAKELFTSQNASGECDCSHSNRCKYPGILDLSPCWYQSPVYGSMPHFSGDQFSELRKSIIGLKPNESMHKSFLDLDPFTGSSLRGSKKLQINTYIEKISALRSTRTVRDDLFLPLFWCEEFGEIDDALEKEIKIKSVYPLIITNHLMVFSLAAGSLFTLISCVSYMCCRNQKKKVNAKNQATYSEKEVKNFQKLPNLENAELTGTDFSNSRKNPETVSTISKDSRSTLGSNLSFIPVQPTEHAKSMTNNHIATHTLGQPHLIPAYRDSFYPNRTASTEIQREQVNKTGFRTQIQGINLPSVSYKPPSPNTLNESMKIISRIIDSKRQNLVKSDFPTDQKERSTNELIVDQRRKKLVKQYSNDSFD